LKNEKAGYIFPIKTRSYFQMIMKAPLNPKASIQSGFIPEITI